MLDPKGKIQLKGEVDMSVIKGNRVNVVKDKTWFLASLQHSGFIKQETNYKIHIISKERVSSFGSGVKWKEY